MSVLGILRKYERRAEKREHGTPVPLKMPNGNLAGMGARGMPLEDATYRDRFEAHGCERFIGDSRPRVWCPKLECWVLQDETKPEPKFGTSPRARTAIPRECHDPRAQEFTVYTHNIKIWTIKAVTRAEALEEARRLAELARYNWRTIRVL